MQVYHAAARSLAAGEMVRLSRLAVIVFCAAALLLGAQGFAAAQPIPGTADITRIPGEQRRLPPLSAPPLQPPPAATAALPAMAVPEGAENITFRLQSIELDGVTAYKPGELAALWQPQLGKEISLLTLYQIAAAITARYQTDGYVLSRAFVPAQEIGDGFARIGVVEGYIAEVQFSGHAPESYLLRQARDALVAQQPLNIKFLERQMLLLNDLPGADFKAVLKPLEKTPVDKTPPEAQPRPLTPAPAPERQPDSGYPMAQDSNCAYSVMAVLPAHRALPGQRETGRVIFVSTGGGEADAIARRLQAAGAELDRCLVLAPVIRRASGKRLLKPMPPMQDLRTAIRRGAALVVMDPINPRFSYRRADGSPVTMTDMLAPLVERASRHPASILAVQSPGRRYTAPQPPPQVEPRDPRETKPAQAKPRSQEGGVLLAIVGAKKDAVRLNFGLDNSSSRFVGPYIAKSRLDLLPESLPYQSTTFTANSEATFSELTDLSVTHTVPLTAEGVVLSLQAGYIRGKPGYTLTPNQVKSKTKRLAATLSWDAVRQRTENLNLSLGLDIQDSRTDLLGGLLTNDKVRQARLGAHYDRQDKLAGANVVDLTVARGLDIIDSSKPGDADLSRAAGQPDFTKLEASAYRFQSLNPVWSAVFGVAGQIANMPLLSGQEFGYGGQVFGRAYDPSEIVGDRGAAARAELRYDGFKPPQGSLQPFAFVDIGKVWNIDAGQPKKESASSAGAGLRYTHPSGISASITIAQPLIREVDAPQYGDGTAPRLIFSISGDIVPPADFFAKP